MQLVIVGQVLGIAKISRPACLAECLDQLHFQFAHALGVLAVGQRQRGLVFVEHGKLFRLATAFYYSDLKSKYSKLFKVSPVALNQIEKTSVLVAQVLCKVLRADSWLLGGDDQRQAILSGNGFAVIGLLNGVYGAKISLIGVGVPAVGVGHGQPFTPWPVLCALPALLPVS